MNLGNLGKIMGLLVVLAGLGGCELPSQMLWSPDGKQAAWRREAELWLIDEKGEIVRTFDAPTTGGMAWTADSRTLYFAAERPTGEAEAEFEVRHDALINSTNGPAATTLPATPEHNGGKDMAIYACANGSPTPLFHVRTDAIWHMQLSPDQRWLAVVGWDDKPERFELFAYSLATQTLYPLAASSGLGICFTGPARLAFVEPSHPGTELEHQTGNIVEIVLDNASDDQTPIMTRTPLVSVLPDRTLWLAALDENILFTSQPQVLPGKPSDADDGVFNLYFYSRADSAVTSIAEEVGPMFAPSPDSKRILFEQITSSRSSGREKKALAVMNSNGSDPHALRDITDTGKPMWPAWRGNDEITFVGPDPKPAPDAQTRKDGKKRLLFDVVQYRLDADGRSLEPIATLSESWPELPSVLREGDIQPPAP